MEYIVSSLAKGLNHVSSYLRQEINQSSDYDFVFYSHDEDSYVQYCTSRSEDDIVSTLVSHCCISLLTIPEYVAMDQDYGHICFYDKNKQLITDFLFRKISNTQSARAPRKIKGDYSKSVKTLLS